MAMELIFLGTGSAYPSPHRGASCVILRTDTQGCWMFDCGEGSQTQLMKSVVKPGKLSRIFITHLHGDHLFGLPGLLCTISQNQPDERPPIEIYGPHGLRRYLRMALSLSRSMLGFQYRVNEVITDTKPGDIDGMSDWTPNYIADEQPHPNELPGMDIIPSAKGTWELCTSGPLKVVAGLLKHRVVSFGYVIKEDDIPGKLQVEKLREFGIPSGPLYGKLKKGESITTTSGTMIHPNDVIGPSSPGRKIVILGDTCDSTGMIDLSMEADVLVHEATNENDHYVKCVENGHSTSGMAGKFAKLIGAKKLILNHFSQRYKSSGEELKVDEESVDKLVQEAQIEFGPQVRAAPWNTTHHFINAMKGKYQLSVSGPADPTGCAEGFSYTRLNPKDSGNPGISSSKRPKSVMGTEADLRKLKLKKARNILRNFGVPEDEINKLSRWKVIDLVRTISTEAAKS